jgi:6-phosphogluconolactonase (cycloisomerase 2 family)
MRTLLIVSAAALLASCGGGSGGSRTSGNPSTPPAGIVSVAGQNQFATFAEATDGTLTPAPASPITAVGSATTCIADPTNSSVVVAYNNSTAVSYQLNAQGSATPASTAVITGSAGAMAESGGRFIYLAENNPGFPQVGVLSLSTTGLLQTLPNQLSTTAVVDLAAHPNGRILIESQNPRALQAFSIDAANNGALAPLGPALTGVGGGEFRSIAFVQGGAFLVVAEGTAPSFPVDVISVNSTTGVLTRVGSPLNVAGSTFVLAHPNGSVVYAFSQNAITRLTVDPNGVLTVGITTQLPAGFIPTAATVDHAATNLFVTGSNGALLQLPLDVGGNLTGTPASTTTLNFQPVCVFAK